MWALLSCVEIIKQCCWGKKKNLSFYLFKFLIPRVTSSQNNYVLLLLNSWCILNVILDGVTTLPCTKHSCMIQQPVLAGLAKMIYIPAIAMKAQGANSIKGALSQFCPYLYDKRRGSFSSIASQRTRGDPKNRQFDKDSRKFSTVYSFHHPLVWF